MKKYPVFSKKDLMLPTYLMGLLSLYSSCSSSGSQTETIEKLEPTKGVVTHLREVGKDSFKIDKEELIDNKTASKVIIKRLSGQVDTLSLSQASKLVNPARDSVVRHHHYHSHPSGLSSILWWGVMGHMMGRSMNQYPPSSYSGMYSSPGSYQRSQSYNTTMRNTASRSYVTRPSSGRSGFFGRRSSSSSSSSRSSSGG